MFRFIVAGLLAAMPVVAHAQVEQQQLVDRASLAAQDLLNNRDGTDAQYVLRRARAVMICPRVLKAGFLFGGQGGDCVLTARDAAGSWSAPAFYGLGGASFGFQAGLQDTQVMFLIMTDRGLRAIMGHPAQARGGRRRHLRRSRRRHRRGDHDGAQRGHRRLQPGTRPVRRYHSGRQPDEREVRLEPSLLRPPGRCAADRADDGGEQPWRGSASPSALPVWGAGCIQQRARNRAGHWANSAPAATPTDAAPAAWARPATVASTAAFLSVRHPERRDRLIRRAPRRRRRRGRLLYRSRVVRIASWRNRPTRRRHRIRDRDRLLHSNGRPGVAQPLLLTPPSYSRASRQSPSAAGRSSSLPAASAQAPAPRHAGQAARRTRSACRSA